MVIILIALTYCDDKNPYYPEESYSKLVDAVLIRGFALKFSDNRSVKFSQVGSLLGKILLQHRVASSVSVFWQFRQTSLRLDNGGIGREVRDETYLESRLFSVGLNLEGSTLKFPSSFTRPKKGLNKSSLPS